MFAVNCFYSYYFPCLFSFACRLVFVELITAPQPQQCSTGSVRMDPTERHHLLFHLMVLFGSQVSKKEKPKSPPFSHPTICDNAEDALYPVYPV